MSRTQTFFIKPERLLACGDDAITVIRLMMATNDIALANVCLAKYKEDQSPTRKHVQKGARLYFVRLQIGHLNEAIKIIQEIRDTDTLFKFVSGCSNKSQEAFTRLTNCLNGGPDYHNFKKYVEIVRHKTIFHYDPKLVRKALVDLAERTKRHIPKLTLGNHISLWRFEVADDIMNSIISHHIWKIPKEGETQEEIDRIAQWGSDLCRDFVGFAGEFSSKFIQKHAVI